MTDDPRQVSDAQTTPIGSRTTCPQCGVQLDAFTTSCGACGAVVTGGVLDAARMEKVKTRLQEGVGAGYKLGGMLGRGGMGIVFQAREVALDRDVALKVLAFDPILNPDAFERFEREARLAARLDHPNIVPIFSVGQGNGIAFYTMRMVRGGSVEALVGAGRALDVDRALAILRDVASALDYAHGQGIVHRDIKPANVLLGESGHAMVADFGIARAFSGPTSSGATATGTGVVGSPAYMSPEQWRGEKVDGRADQYALGVLAFELLAGTRPFSGESMQELLRMHLQDDAPDIISVRHDLPGHFTDAIRRALSKAPGDRFATSTEFVAVLGGSARTPMQPSTATVRTPAPVAAATGARASLATPRGPVVGGRESAARAQRSLLPWLALLAIAAVGAGVIWKLAPSTTASAAGAAPAPAGTTPAPVPAAVNLDSIGDVEKRLQAEIAAARRLAMNAEHRADSLAAANVAAGAATARRNGAAASREAPHAHVYVFAEGGAPQVYLDGVSQKATAPVLLQVPPGRHSVRVQGIQPFSPADTMIELAAEDTATVVFRNVRLAQRGKQNAGAANLNGGGAVVDSTGHTPAPVIDWADWTRKLGFDPRTVQNRQLTPDQRVKYRRFLQFMDSTRRAGRRPQ